MDKVQKEMQKEIDNLKEKSEWLSTQLEQACASLTAYEILFHIGVMQQGPHYIQLLITNTERPSDVVAKSASGYGEGERFAKHVHAKIADFRSKMEMALKILEQEETKWREADWPSSPERMSSYGYTHR